MVHVLHLDSSARSEQQSVTRQLGRELLTQWHAQDPDLAVVHRDLATDPPSHVTAPWVTAAFAVDDSADRTVLAESEVLVEELLAADVLVVGAPMYNFGIPSTLKAWVDQVVRVGRTFGFVGALPVGLVTGTRAIVLGATGGDAVAYEQVGLDHRASYLRAILGFLGIHDVELITVGLTAVGDPDLGASRGRYAAAITGAAAPAPRSPGDALHAV
ncbi:MAG: FMN-dependent NADH-azoreductase [Frankiales bacterium]|nr:FMN-dependent NADH-azoreductase [Frankiales bacterium]